MFLTLNLTNEHFWKDDEEKSGKIVTKSKEIYNSKFGYSKGILRQHFSQETFFKLLPVY